MRTEAEIREQIKDLEEAILKLEPGVKDEHGIIWNKKQVKDLKARYKGSILALKYVLAEKEAINEKSV